MDAVQAVLGIKGKTFCDGVGKKNQVAGGISAWEKNSFNIEFVKEWDRFAARTHLVDDSPSVLPNCPSYKKHRHDQSILTLLVDKFDLRKSVVDTDIIEKELGLRYHLWENRYN